MFYESKVYKKVVTEIECFSTIWFIRWNSLIQAEYYEQELYKPVVNPLFYPVFFCAAEFWLYFVKPT